MTVMSSVENAPVLSRGELLRKIASLVAAGLPTPNEISFNEDRPTGYRFLKLTFDSTSEMDAWMSLVWDNAGTSVFLTADADGNPTSWQYRPTDDCPVRWAGWLVYPVVLHQLTPEMLAGPHPAGER